MRVKVQKEYYKVIKKKLISNVPLVFDTKILSSLNIKILTYLYLVLKQYFYMSQIKILIEYNDVKETK